MRSAYRKMLAIAAIGVTAVFLMLTLVIYRRTWEVRMDDFRHEMVRTAEQLAAAGELYFLPHDQRYTDSYQGFVCRTAEVYEAEIWICDTLGNVLYAADEAGMPRAPSIRDAVLRPKLMPYLQESFFDLEQKGTDSFDEDFIHESITFGYPVLLDGIRGMTLGVVLVHVPRPGFTKPLGTTFSVLLASYLIMLAFAILFVYYIYYRYGYVFSGVQRLAAKKPVLEMPEAFHGQDESARALLNLERELNREEASQTAFVANASHELRSPMTSIQGFAQGMLEGLVPQEEYPRYLSIIVEESRRLNSLIRDLLDLSRIEGQLTPRSFVSFELHEKIRQVLVSFEGRIEEKHIEPILEFTTETAYVIGDPDRISQVFVNLIDNAVKYSPEGGTIRIWTYPTLNDRIMIGVTDTGNGIPQEDIPHIFDRFYKVDTSHSGKTGTGLGLAIVKQILEKHDTEISVHSIQGRGTTFSFTLRTPQE